MPCPALAPASLPPCRAAQGNRLKTLTLSSNATQEELTKRLTLWVHARTGSRAGASATTAPALLRQCVRACVHVRVCKAEYVLIHTRECVCACVHARVCRAENVLKLSELCRKYETEQEKVIPFYVPPQVRAGVRAGAHLHVMSSFIMIKHVAGAPLYAISMCCVYGSVNDEPSMRARRPRRCTQSSRLRRRRRRRLRGSPLRPWAQKQGGRGP